MNKTYTTTQYTNGYEFAQGSGYVLPEYPSTIPNCVATGEPEQHDVVIVGGGLCGLTLACALAQQGVQAVLLDEDHTVGVKGASSRGICYTQKSLEIFDRLGIGDKLIAKGIQWHVGRTFAGYDEIYQFDLKQQATFCLSEQPAFINIQQFYLEGYLVERLYALSSVSPCVALRWDNRLTHIAPHVHDTKPSNWHLTVETPQGSYTIQARYVVDCTGSASLIRQQMGIPLEGKRANDRWCIADVRFKTQPPTERHTWIEAPFNEQRAVWQHLMADNVWRIDYQMPHDADPAYVSREEVVRERLIQQFGHDVDV